MATIRIEITVAVDTSERIVSTEYGFVFLNDSGELPGSIEDAIISTIRTEIGCNKNAVIVLKVEAKHGHR